MNLLQNALKFTTEGFIKVFASYNEETQYLTVSVTDTGLGIKEED